MSVISLQQADVFRLLQSSNAKWIIGGVNLLLVVWIASLLGSLTWDIVAPQGADQVENVEVSPLQVATDSNAHLIRQLPGWHLMGAVAKKQAAVVVDTPVDAPDTRLKLILRGVFSSEASGNARAIIADPKGEEEQYAVGSTLPGNAELSEIYPDRVILKRNGRYETLRLVVDSPSRGTAARSPATTLAKNQAQRIRELRQKAKKSPKSLLQVVRPRPYRNAEKVMQGYTLQPGRDPALFQELGLQAGDIVVQLNGVKLDSAANGMQALKSIQSGDSVSMSILRGGQEQAMNFKMPE